MNAIDLRPHILACGYNESQLARNVEIDSGQRIPLIAFAHSPHDSRSSCFAVIDNVTAPQKDVALTRVIGAPLIFASFNNQWQLWKQEADKPRLWESIAPANLDSFFEQNRTSLAPDAVYRAKTWARIDKNYQLSFVDAGLMPLIEEEAGRKLSGLIERTVIDTKRRLGWEVISDDQGHWLLESNFWLLAGKILRDKRVGAFVGLDLEDLEKVFGLVAQHYGAVARVSVRSAFEAEALRESAREISNFSNLELLTIEALAYLYENALITDATRIELGTHSTPSYLVDYIVWKLRPWIEELPVDERHTFEPACGHAAFLMASMRLLSDLLPANTYPINRHDYLRDRLHGCDIESFALEIARLSLTLSDVPNPNGWDLQRVNMFQPGILRKYLSNATIVLANPPFRVARQLLGQLVTSMRPGAVLGVVVPRGLLHSEGAASIRETIARDFEIEEICLFPDKVFTFSSAESAVILARRTQQTNLNGYRILFRRVREGDFANFKKTYDATSESHVLPTRFSADNQWAFVIPDLDEVWEYCRALPKFAEVATIGKGFDLRSIDDPDFPTGSIRLSDVPLKGFSECFVEITRNLQTHELPPVAWINPAPLIVKTPRYGMTTHVPQVLLNYSPVSRGPWRLKALRDSEGHAVSSIFLVVRPNDRVWPIEALWGLCNSPLANAYAYSFSTKRHILAGTMRSMPVPDVTLKDLQPLIDLVRAYFDAVRAWGGRLSDRGYLSNLRALHWRIDAEVLRLYKLPAQLERQLLDLFAEARRRGVPFDQTRYFPEAFTDALTLQQLLSITTDWDETNERRTQLIHKQIDKRMSAEEKDELDLLQKLADSRIRLIAPLPITQLEAVKEDLKRRGIWEETNVLT